MELLYVIYTYNRPRVLQECIRSLFGNNDLKPDRVVFIDDGSEKAMKTSLFNEVMSSDSLLDMVSFKKNVGYGRAAEIGFAMADMFQPRYCFFIESDYIFRKHGLDEVYDVLQSDLGKNLAGVAGYSHPDFFDSQCTETRYPKEMASLFAEDNLNRSVLYKSFGFKSRFGNIQLQYVSNSCGTMYLNWRLITQMRAAFYPRMEKEWIQRTCGKGEAKRLLHDGVMSCGLSYFWMEYARSQGWDTQKEAALMDIVPSVANHICGGGIFGKDGVAEGQTFVGSPSFPRNYNQ